MYVFSSKFFFSSLLIVRTDSLFSYEQYTHTLRDVIGAPPIPPYFDEDGDVGEDGTDLEVFIGVNTVEGDCEGSAFSSIMRKLAAGDY